MASLLYNRNYRLLITASGVSNLGDGVSALAFPWLATLITRDPLLIAMVAFARHLPWLLFTLPAGVWTDRLDRRQIILRADFIRCLLTIGVIAVIFSLPALPPPENAALYITALSILAFALGLAEVLRDNAAQTVLPAIVPKEALETANGRLWSIEHIMGSFVGPPLAGILIAYAVPAPFVLDAVTFAVAAALVWTMAIPTRVAPARRPLQTELAEAWRWMRSHPVILRLAILLGLLNFAGSIVLTMIVLYSQELLGLGAFGHGVLLTAGAAGGVIGGFVCPWIAARIGRRASLLAALALILATYLLLVLTTDPILTGLSLFAEMFAAVLWNVVTVSYRQRLIPDALLGRVNAIYRFFGWGPIPLGALAGGWITALFVEPMGRDMALRLPFAAAAFITALLGLYALARLRL